MAANIELIAKIVQKNGGTFKLLDAVNIDWAGFSFADLGTDALAAMKVYTTEQTDSAIAAAIAAAPHLQRKAVDALPEVADANENTIYMVKRATPTTSPDGVDAYDEYMLINGAFEHIGSTVVDLSDYIKTEDAEAKIAAALIEAKAAASTAETNAKAYADSLAPNYATAEQGATADSAVQPEDITEGTVQGAIQVGETAVPVHGLGTAAYENKDAFDTKGSAATAEANAKAYVDEQIGEVDLSGIATNAGEIAQIKEDLAGTEAKATQNAADIVTANGNIANNKAAIDKLNDAETVEGSVDYKVKQAKDALQAQIEQLGEISGGNIATITTQVEQNTAAINKLNGGVDENGSVDQKVNTAKTELQGNIDTVDGKADAAQAAAEAAQTTADEAKAAAATADGKAVAAQTTADEAKAAAATADGKAVAAQTAADAAQSTADEAKTATETNAGAITTLEGRVKANEDAIEVLNGDSNTEGSVDYKVARAVAEIVTDDNNKDSVNTLEEIAAWIANHPESAADLNAAIQANTGAINALKALVGEALPADAEATTVIAYIEEAKQAAIAAAATDAQSKADAAQAAAIAAAATDAQSKADAAQAAAEATAAGLANAAQANAEATASADATAKAATAKSEAIAAAATDAQSKADAAQAAAEATAAADAKTKADAAEQAAKDYADGLADNYATAAQGAKADTALQSIAGVENTVADNVATITGISTDLLTQGTNVLVLNGGGAF